MARSYKERLTEYKEEKHDSEKSFSRKKPKAKRPKPYKVTANFSFTSTRLANDTIKVANEKRVCIGRYATRKDADKAMLAAVKHGFYYDIRLEYFGEENA